MANLDGSTALRLETSQSFNMNPLKEFLGWQKRDLQPEKGGYIV